MKEKIIGLIVGLIYRIYSSTFRYRVSFANDDAKFAYDRLMKKSVEQNYICAVWHEDEMALIPHFRDQKIFVMVSDSKDGTMFTKALAVFGLLTVRGSSSRGGIKAFIAALKKLREGKSMAIAIDGPRGPRREIKDGVIKLSEKSELKIVPLRAVTTNAYCFDKSWSKSKLPYPFSVINVAVGTPSQCTKEKLKSLMDELV